MTGSGTQPFLNGILIAESFPAQGVDQVKSSVTHHQSSALLCMTQPPFEMVLMTHRGNFS